MKIILSVLLLVTLLGAACATPPTPAPTVASQPTAIPATVTIAPTAAPAATATTMPAATATKPPATADLRAEQLLKLQALMRDPNFAFEMAQYVDAAYYKGLNQPVPPFLAPGEDTATNPKSVKEEKIAINLAGFYAVEAGVGVISEFTREAPVDILDSVAKGTRSPSDMLLIARFANATWKAGQPFRSLSRITRDNFIPAALLPQSELQKDFDQIKAASQKTLDAMQDVKGKDRNTQLLKLQALMRDPNFAFEMAQYVDAAYYKGQNQPVPPFLAPGEDTATNAKSVKEEKIAINLAGFYAVEAGIGVISENTKEAPVDILDSVAKGTRSPSDMLLIARFANATWKAGQPFRSLSRITRDNFIPAALLPQSELQKDFDQIKAASQKTLDAMKK